VSAVLEKKKKKHSLLSLVASALMSNFILVLSAAAETCNTCHTLIQKLTSDKVNKNNSGTTSAFTFASLLLLLVVDRFCF
jgi:hypothetical protein